MPLGRGLGSLIPPKTTTVTGSPASAPASAQPQAPAAPITLEVSSSPEVLDTRERIWRLNVDKIKANSVQPRRDFASQALNDLADSIREHGILQPLVVIKQGEGYELIAGERRLRAARLAGLREVPAIIREADEQRKLELALIENIQREDLNPIEVARSVKKLADEFNLTQEAVAKRLSKSRSTIANVLRLLTLSEEIQQALAEGRISEGHAKILLGLESAAKQSIMFNKIVAGHMSVADTADVVRKNGGTKQAKIKADSADEDKEAKFREFFGAKTKIKRGKQGGKVELSFYSDEELLEMLKKLK